MENKQRYTFQDKRNSAKKYKMRKVNLITMAGLGLRFKNKGFKLPKPLIEIDNLPMFVRSVRKLPGCDLLIFICLKLHVKNFNLHKVIEKYFPKAKIVILNKKTQGQAVTCLKAQKYLKPNDLLTIASCDYGMTYNKNLLNKNLNSSDLVVWTFKDVAAIKKKPTSYGYVKTNKKYIINATSCKKTLSKKPWEDDAIIGTFTFKKAKLFIQLTKKLIKKKVRVNNEFYIDSLIAFFINSKYTAKSLRVNKYNGWGTPFELKKYKNEKNN